MKGIFKRHEELLFTAVAYGLLCVVFLAFLSVRFTKATYAKFIDGPLVLSLYPSKVVPGASQKITLLSDRTHFGPQTVVHSSMPGVTLSRVRFTSPREMSFELYVHEFAAGGADEVPLSVRSPKDGGESEEVNLTLSLTQEGEPLELDLFNLECKDSVTVDSDYVMFGYRPKGYAPFHFSVKDLEGGKVYKQETEGEVEHLGLQLLSPDNAFELSLSDALGREVRKVVFVHSKGEPSYEGVLASRGAEFALTGTYTGKPTQWNSDPQHQVAASDCILGNGPMGCSAGCGKRIRPPPNDYLTTLGQADCPPLRNPCLKN